jgi:hypothetical protein
VVRRNKGRKGNGMHSVIGQLESKLDGARNEEEKIMLVD